mmetsp:Transcript_3634/g.7266  ORF Transcript_3634/g.7266 Transcript_3634/m.7266 type:complete len:688 (+) Transcript_3634:110-2173(+)
MPSYEEERDEKLVRSTDFDGPTRHRHCTDVLCLGLIIVMWTVMTAIGIYAMSEGDYRLVLFPMDYDGNVCGVDFNGTDMTDFPNLYYVNSFTGGVCVSNCPSVKNALANMTVTDGNETTTVGEEGNITTVVKGPSVDLRTFITYGGLWQAEGALLDPDFIQIADYSSNGDARFCTEETCFPDQDDPPASWTSRGVRRGFGFAYYAGDTYELLWRCYYTTQAEAQIEDLVGDGDGGLNVVDDATALWNRIFADMYTARKYIFGFGFGLSLGVSLVYIFLMRLPLVLDVLVWVSLLITITLFLVGGYFVWDLADGWEKEDPQSVEDETVTATKGVAVVLFILGALVLILTVCLRKAIQTAIGCVKEAGRAVNHMFLILLVPVLQAVALLIFLVCFIYYSVNLASLGEITTRDIPVDEGGTEISVREYEFDEFVQRCGWYYLFCFFWTANFIVSAGDMIIAVAVAHYYFARNKATIGSWTVLTSIFHVCFYHLGTCAYGSLIIAIIQVIRVIIARAQREAKKANSKIAQAILCCCQCCFCCLEKCLKFLNKNAYIQTAIFSTPFCKSARKAFFLIVRNAARIAALTYVSAAVLIVGKLFISAVTTVIAYYVLLENLVQDLNSVGGPLAIIFLLSYWLSDMFMDVFDMAIATTLHCVVADEEMNDGNGEYTEKELKDFVDKHAQEGDEYDG